MIRKDDRTPEQQMTHTLLVVGTDRCLSSWGEATGGTSIAAWACTIDNLDAVDAWVRSRKDMKSVRLTTDSPRQRYYPGKTCAHLHIYVVESGHPALS